MRFVIQNRRRLLLLASSILVIGGVQVVAEAAEGEARVEKAAQANPKAWAVGTFECLGLYYNREGEAAECRAQYRKVGEADWRAGLPLVHDARLGQYRGSLVGLTPDTEYDIRLACGGESIVFNARTRSEKFPVGKTTTVPAGESGQPLRITESGTSQAWHLVSPAPGTKATIDVFGLSDYCVEVAANFVIVRGLELVNAGQHAVLIRRGVQNVVVEDCHMIRWGRIGGARVWGATSGSDSGVYADRGAGGLIIQRNLIEHPRGGANDWESGHPSGPQGISLENSSGGNVIRYNEIRSTEDHGFNDGFGGGSNFSFEGSPNCDSDIYGNIITNCWDDAIESEGANRNVRIWSNYIDKTFVFVATASTAMGPLYIFRNVFGESRVSHKDRTGGMIIKTGQRDVELDGQKVSTGLGRRFIFHSTALQPNGALDVFSGHDLSNAVTRNNIFRVRGQTYPSPRGSGSANDFRNDLTTGYLGGGFVQSMFLPSNRLEWFFAPTMNTIKWGLIESSRGGKNVAITDPMVSVPNPALDKGARIPGFNDDFQGAAPDIGAFESGNPPLRFGRDAAPGFQRAPWETQ
jgi:hypothetical protein